MNQLTKAHKEWHKYKVEEYKMIEGYIQNPTLKNSYNVSTKYSKLQLLKERTGNLMEYYSVLKL